MTVNYLTHKEIARLDEDDEAAITFGFKILSEAIAANNYEKGWRSPDTPLEETRPMGDLIALLHSEVTEAFEAYRNGEPGLWYEYEFNGIKTTPEDDVASYAVYTVPGHSDAILGKPQGIASELADVLIRVLDMAEEKGIPLLQAIFDKHAYNQTRPYRHGGKAV